MLAAMTRTRTTQAQRTGDEAEQAVVARLAAAGWTILGRNARFGRGELDIVAIDPGPPGLLVVVEVRRRGRRDFGLAEETLDLRKRGALRRTIAGMLAAGCLADGTRLPRLELRVDLVAIDLAADGRASVRHHRGIRL